MAADREADVGVSVVGAATTGAPAFDRRRALVRASGLAAACWVAPVVVSFDAAFAAGSAPPGHLEFRIVLSDCSGGLATDDVVITHLPSGDTFLVEGGLASYSPPHPETGHHTFFASGYTTHQPPPGLVQSNAPVDLRFAPTTCDITVQGNISLLCNDEPPAENVVITYVTEYETGSVTAYGMAHAEDGPPGFYQFQLAVMPTDGVVDFTFDPPRYSPTTALLSGGGVATIDFRGPC